MSRNTIRGILVGIIMLTIPCYVVGIIAWWLPGDSSLPDVDIPGGGDDTITATWTPIDPNRVTERPTDIFNLPLTPDFLLTQAATARVSPFPTATQFPPFQQPTSIPPPTDILFTVAPVATNTPFPTNTPFATSTPRPTNTPAATPTATPTEAILQPPTDTPAP